jgi:hypothetical protein
VLRSRGRRRPFARVEPCFGQLRLLCFATWSLPARGPLGYAVIAPSCARAGLIREPPSETTNADRPPARGASPPGSPPGVRAPPGRPRDERPASGRRSAALGSRLPIPTASTRRRPSGSSSEIAGWLTAPRASQGGSRAAIGRHTHLCDGRAPSLLGARAAPGRPELSRQEARSSGAYPPRGSIRSGACRSRMQRARASRRARNPRWAFARGRSLFHRLRR